MRHAILLILGLFVGAVCAFLLARGLAQRDAYPRGLMAVMQHHVAALARQERAGQCAAAQTAAHRERLGVLAQDVAEALGATPGGDPHLGDYAAGLARATAAAADAADCPALHARLGAIRDACEACHRDYR